MEGQGFRPVRRSLPLKGRMTPTKCQTTLARIARESFGSASDPNPKATAGPTKPAMTKATATLFTAVAVSLVCSL